MSETLTRAIITFVVLLIGILVVIGLLAAGKAGAMPAMEEEEFRTLCLKWYNNGYCAPGAATATSRLQELCYKIYPLSGAQDWGTDSSYKKCESLCKNACVRGK